MVSGGCGNARVCLNRTMTHSVASNSLESDAQHATKILIFNQASNERDSIPVLENLAAGLKDVPIQHVIFAGYNPDQEFDTDEGKTSFPRRAL